MYLICFCSVTWFLFFLCLCPGSIIFFAIPLNSIFIVFHVSTPANPVCNSSQSVFVSVNDFIFLSISSSSYFYCLTIITSYWEILLIEAITIFLPQTLGNMFSQNIYIVCGNNFHLFFWKYFSRGVHLSIFFKSPFLFFCVCLQNFCTLFMLVI